MGYGKYGVLKIWSRGKYGGGFVIENMGYRKYGVLKIWSIENMEYRKYGV